MPLFDYQCQACGAQFEELVRGDEVPPCPVCGAADPQRLYSRVSRPAKFGLRGLEARHSNAVRRNREEQRRERRELRRERDGRGS